MKIINNLMIKYLNILNECNILGENLTNLLQEIFTVIKICVPIACLTLIAIDIVNLVISGNSKSTKETLNRSIKRLIIGIVIFIIPTIVNFVLNMSGYLTGTCGIG